MTAPEEKPASDPKPKQELHQEDLNQIQDIAKKILNPNNDNPTMNEYISSTFAYIGNALMKMQTTNDRQATAKEIADDLTKKFETWVQNREAEKKKQEEEAAQQTITDAAAEKKE